MQITEANRATRTDEQRSCLRTISIKDPSSSNWGVLSKGGDNSIKLCNEWHQP